MNNNVAQTRTTRPSTRQTSSPSMGAASLPQVLAMVMCPAGETDPLLGLLAEMEELMGEHCAALLVDDAEHPRHALAYMAYKRAMAARELYGREADAETADRPADWQPHSLRSLLERIASAARSSELTSIDSDAQQALALLDVMDHHVDGAGAAVESADLSAAAEE